MPANSRFAYLHVPKAAGTALTNAIEECLGEGSLATLRFDRSVFGAFERFDELTPTIRAAIGTNDEELAALGAARFAAGHFSLSTLERHFPTDRIFTVLREPRARLLSQYEFWRAQTDEENALWAPYDLPVAARASLGDFLVDRTVATSTDNVVCRLALGPDPRLPVGDFIEARHYKALAAEAVTRFRRLRKVAIIETETPSFEPLAAALGLELVVAEENVSRGGDTPAALDDAVLARLDTRTAIDARIYEAFAEGVLAAAGEVGAAADRLFRARLER